MSGYVNVPTAVAEKAAKEAKQRGSTLTHAAGIDDVRAHSKIVKAQRTVKQAVEHFGASCYDESTDTVTVDMTKTRNRKKVAEFHEDEIRLTGQRGAHVADRTPMIDIVRRDGRRKKIRAVNEDLVTTVAHRFGADIHAVLAAPSAKLGRVLEKRGGIMWRSRPNGSWEPLHRCTMGTPLTPCSHPRCFQCNPQKKARAA